MTRVAHINGHNILLDEEDYIEFIESRKYRWYVRKEPNTHYVMGYKIGDFFNRTSLHRFIMKAKRGEFVDHRNHLGLDNRKSNLRICTNSENARNRVKKFSNKSGYKGVCFRKRVRKNPWRAVIKVGKKQISLGCYDTPLEAAKAYDYKAKELFGEFAFLNFPDEELTPINQKSGEHNKTGFRGVSQDKSRWVAQIGYGGEHYFVKRCLTPIEAAEVYDNLAIILFGEKAKLNFPDRAPSTCLFCFCVWTFLYTAFCPVETQEHSQLQSGVGI